MESDHNPPNNPVTNLTNQLPVEILYVIGALFAIVALYALSKIFFGGKGARGRRDTFLLVGLCDAGKTVLHYQLQHGKQVKTCTSMKENEGTFPLHSETADSVIASQAEKKPLHVIDLPGHEKQRFRFPEFATISAGIVFLVDSASISQNSVQVAEYLYEILSNNLITKNKVPVLVACNKTDMPQAISAAKIRVALEKEIDKLRVTRTAAPDMQGEAANTTQFLGYDGEAFNFDHVENLVEFAEISAVKGGDKIQPVEIWMRGITPL